MGKRWTEEDKQWQEYRRQATLMKVTLPTAPWEEEDEAGFIERFDKENREADRRIVVGRSRGSKDREPIAAVKVLQKQT